ncbi:MAG: type II toxin-antitoxin system VapC family toxin [Acidobacteriota bacterium]|nr:type II toxin-antitoxin system VapC family toxin [Acidobacteriota bacterium]
MSRIFLDTNIFVYLFADEGPRGKRAADIFNEISLRGDEVLTSALTLGELLVKPLEANDLALADRYRKAFRSPAVRVISFDEAAGVRYARIRQDRSIKAPDAIQLATAAVAGCDLFITNDERLARTRVQGIHFIASMERAPI